MPEPAKIESVPPVTVTIAAVKLTGASLSENVSRADSPALRADVSAVIPIVGATISIRMAGSNPPAVLGLPAASTYVPALTTTVPEPLKPTVGVNIAV